MNRWTGFLLAVAAPLMLAGCLWSPGKFQSNLDIRRDGSFALDYKGEILFQMPQDDAKPEPWSDDLVTCSEEGEVFLSGSATDLAKDGKPTGSGESNGAPDVYTERPCTPAEIATLKREFEAKEAERIAAKRKENEEMARTFGLPGTDDASNRRFAATLMKYAGWRSVAYKGNGVYDVNYSVRGRLDQDFVFPLMPDSDLMLPFIAIRRRADGSVQVNSPGFAGGEGPFAARASLMGLGRKGGGDEPMRADGRFTITTDGEILTNNSADGPAADARGRVLSWQVSPSTTKTPEALIRLR
jgi:hypothetical protein